MVAGDAYFGFEAFGFHGGFQGADLTGETMHLGAREHVKLRKAIAAAISERTSGQ
jgi:hypothetical protein